MALVAWAGKRWVVDRLALLELEGPAGLRLDVCESCKGYLKTYTGQGQEALFLADWPTLVLDAMAGGCQTVQALSTRTDLVPSSYARELAKSLPERVRCVLGAKGASPDGVATALAVSVRR